MQSGDPDECSPPGVASFHLVREPLWRAPVALARLGTDLLRLRGTPGLRFARLLGTGRGATAMGADLARTAIFAVWDDPAALAAFEVGWFAARTAQVRAAGGEVYGVSLALLSGHGRWGGRDVLADLRRPRLPLVPGTASGEPGTGGPVAVLTRATVRPSRWHRFRGSRPPVVARARRCPRAAGRRRHRRSADRAAGHVQHLVRRRRGRRLRAQPRAPGGGAPHPGGGLVRRGAVRPVHAAGLDGHVGRPRPAVGADAPSPLETVGVAVYSPVTLRGEEGR